MALEGNINTYQGNAALGQGGSAGADIGPIGPIDLKEVNDAVDKTTYYQILEKRDKWAQNNIVLGKMATEAAEGLKFSLGEISELNRGRITDKIANLNKYYTEHPTAFTLDPYGSNAKEVAEMQQMTNDINASIKSAQGQRVQQLGIVKQLNEATSPAKRQAIQAHLATESVKPLGEDMFLWADLVPYKFAAAPVYNVAQAPRQDTLGYVYIDTLAMPDLTAAVQNYTVDQQTNPDAARAITSGAKNFNDVYNKIKADNPGLSEQQYHNLMAASPEGKAYMTMYDHAQEEITFQNGVIEKNPDAAAGRTKLPTLDIFKRGISEDDYKLIQAASNSKARTSTSEVDKDYYYRQASLANQRFENQTGRIRANTEKTKVNAEITAAKDKSDPDAFPIDDIARTFKNMIAAQGQTELADKDGWIPVNRNTELLNIFGDPLDQKITVKDKTSGDKEINNEYTKLPVTGLYVQGSGQSIDDVKFKVVKLDPATGKETSTEMSAQEVWDRMYRMGGEKNEDKAKKAMRQIESITGQSYPGMERLSPKEDKPKLDEILGKVKEYQKNPKTKTKEEQANLLNQVGTGKEPGIGSSWFRPPEAATKPVPMVGGKIDVDTMEKNPGIYYIDDPGAPGGKKYYNTLKKK